MNMRISQPGIPLRVLVVDDSARTRKNIADLLIESGEVQVVGRAGDGEEALRLASVLRPDAITLDLEMPKMDGFTFLRILMAKQPTPVIVVSTQFQREPVFRALELGALDFVAKPEATQARGPNDPDPDAEFKRKLLQTIMLARSPGIALRLTKGSLPKLPQGPPPSADSLRLPPKHVIAIAASTGGPSALVEVFARLPDRLNAAILIAQHMPERFTKTFAERLDKRGPLRVTEAVEGEPVYARRAYLCPGGCSLELAGSPPDLKLRVRPAEPGDRYVPNADKLFGSVAKAVGPRATGVVLTGMGDDGAIGAKAIIEAGGMIFVESEVSAVVFGMPAAVIRTGIAPVILPVGAIGDALAQLV